MFEYKANKLIIDSFIKIVSVSINKIVFKYKSYNLIIYGDNLILLDLFDHGAKIKGIINKIVFDYGVSYEL